MIPLIRNTFFNESETKRDLADFILNSSTLSMGKTCFEFENQFAKYQKSKNCVLFNSGASANLAIIQALLNSGRLNKKDKVGFSAVTWATNVMPLIQLGLTPVPVDCSITTLNVMSDNLKKVLQKEKLRAFFITNALGLTGDLDKISELCRKEKIILLEDNCEALGTELAGKKSGNFGLASSFSFYVAHHMSTIEGGCVCTDDAELAEMLRIVRANGWDRNLSIASQKKWRKKHHIASEMFAKYTFYDLAYNVRPTEITGFIGLNQLKYLEKKINKMENNYIYLSKFVHDNDELISLEHSHISKLSIFSFPVICRTKSVRNKYIEKFVGKGVEVRPVIGGNIARQPFFRKWVSKKYNLPNSDFVSDAGFYCGNYPELTPEELNVIAGCLHK